MDETEDEQQNQHQHRRAETGAGRATATPTATGTGIEAGIVRIVAGVDGSDSALHAALWAAREAECRGGLPLILAHAMHLPEAEVAVLEPDDLAERQQAAGAALVEAVAARVRRHHPGLDVRGEVRPQSPARGLLDASADDVLVVTGTRGHGGFTGMLLGSVSRALAAHADGPLVVVRGAEPEEATGAVVLGVGTDPDESVVAYAFAAARRYGTDLHAVRAWMPPLPVAGVGLPGGVAFGLGDPAALSPPEPDVRDAAEAAAAARAVAHVQSQYPDVKVEVGAAMGNVVPVLAEAAAGARLVVGGAHRHRGLFAVGAGHVTEGLLSHSPAPVAVIPVSTAANQPSSKVRP